MCEDTQKIRWWLSLKGALFSFIRRDPPPLVKTIPSSLFPLYLCLVVGRPTSVRKIAIRRRDPGLGVDVCFLVLLTMEQNQTSQLSLHPRIYSMFPSKSDLKYNRS